MVMDILDIFFKQTYSIPLFGHFFNVQKRFSTLMLNIIFKLILIYVFLNHKKYISDKEISFILEILHFNPLLLLRYIKSNLHTILIKTIQIDMFNIHFSIGKVRLFLKNK